MAQLLANVDQAVSDAGAALLRAEQEREAARTALRMADADVEEARGVLDRLERLRHRLAGDAEI